MLGADTAVHDTAKVILDALRDLPYLVKSPLSLREGKVLPVNGCQRQYPATARAS